MNLGLSFCDGVARLVIFPLDVGYQIAKLHQDSLLTTNLIKYSERSGY
jgi:hypothetical protein